MAFEYGHLGDYDANTGVWQSARRNLTDAEKAILATELTGDPTGRGYAGKDAQATADLVNGTYTKNNLAARGTVPLPPFVAADFANILSPYLVRVYLLPDTNANKPLYLAWLEILKLVTTVNTADPNVQGILEMAIQDGVLPQEMYTSVTSQPDPDWQAELVQPSRASVLFTNPLLLIDAGDVEAARGGDG